MKSARFSLLLIYTVLFIPKCLFAVELSQTGTGQVLLFPYYTAHSNAQSLMEVINHSNETKALKVRVLEPRNGRAVLDLNVYLPPLATFAAAIATNSEGRPAMLVESANQCVVPIHDSGERFSEYQFHHYNYSGLNNDSGPEDISRALSGSVQVFEMGVLDSDLVASESCEDLQSRWTIFNNVGGTWVVDPSYEIKPPSGGISGRLSLINVERGIMGAVNAVVLDKFSDNNTHTSPGDELPDLDSGHNSEDENGLVISRVLLPSGEWLEDRWRRSVDAVSAVLMKARASINYNANKLIGAKTELMVSMPTKHHYVDSHYTGETVIAPFKNLFADGMSLVPFTFQIANRKGELAGDFVTSLCVDPPCGRFNPEFDGAFCFQNTVYAINNDFRGEGATSDVLQTPLFGDFGLAENASDYVNGVLKLDFTQGDDFSNELVNNISGNRYQGLPIITTSITRFQNGTLVVDEQRILANYAMLVPALSEIEVIVPDSQ